jgi:transcription initiation factor TFIIIB Brf1 subunit/transcription initiation factor TFIIB
MSGESRVTLGDLEERIRRLTEQAQRSANAVRPAVPGVAGVAVAAIVVVAFVLGYRRGRRSSVLEITRL